MTLYLYKIGITTPLLVIGNVAAYTADTVQTEDGTVYSSLAEDCELSALPDCSQTLRADCRSRNPTSEERIEELEALVAGVLFGGEDL